jgi:hypothetical protein
MTTIGITIAAGAAAVALISVVGWIDEWQRGRIERAEHKAWKRGVEARRAAREGAE